MSGTYDLSALVTALAALLFLWTTLRVGAGRAKYKVPAPATTGPAEFERLFRVQMNTLEGLALFLPALWLFAIYWDDRIAAALGGVWLAGRLLYALAYAGAAERRGLGFAVQGLAMLVLLIGALAGIVRALLAGGG